MSKAANNPQVSTDTKLSDTRIASTKGGNKGLVWTSLVILILLFATGSVGAGDEGRLVRVGIFQNEPIIYQDESGVTKGLYADILNAIAEEEGWEIDYVLDSWDGCLERLRTSDIDLLSSVAYTEERDAFADFSQEVVWTLWGLVFVHPESGIEDVPSMAGKKVAVLKNGINGINFQNLCREFGVSCGILPMPSYDAAFKAVEAGRADAAVVNSVFGSLHGPEYRVNRSSIVFSPINAFFAVPHGQQGDLAAVVDGYLENWKQDNNSVYHRSLRQYLIPELDSAPFVPDWIVATLVVLAVGLLGVFFWVWLLRRLVDARTASLRESEKRHRLLTENLPQKIFSKDANSVYVSCNKNYALDLGIAADEIAGKTDADFYPAELAEKFRADDQRFLRAGRVEETVDSYIKDGQEMIIQTVRTPLTDDSGVVTGILGIFWDITETRRLQALESRAARLETAGTIAGQVAHDFNNLLAPLMAYPDCIREELPEQHAAHVFIDSIEHAAEKISEINQDLLTMGRRGYYNQEAINLNRLVMQSAQEMQSRTQTVEIKTDICDDLMNIVGGTAQIHRVLDNLIGNALDATQPSGVITVKTENYYVNNTSIAFSRIPKGEYVKLTVSDTGCGIPDDISEQILDPFFTTKVTDKKRGSGLGLSVVDAVVKDHSGYLDMSSKVGRGSSFYLYFPIFREIAAQSELDQIVGGSESILIVDDDTVQLEVSSLLLSKLGYCVRAVESGEEAIAFARENPQDLLILDMVMPDGIDGTDTYRGVLDINPYQKAILLSGFSESKRVLEAQQLGAGAFVMKPVTRKIMAVAVRTELDRPRRVNSHIVVA